MKEFFYLIADGFCLMWFHLNVFIFAAAVAAYFFFAIY